MFQLGKSSYDILMIDKIKWLTQANWANYQFKHLPD